MQMFKFMLNAVLLSLLLAGSALAADKVNINTADAATIDQVLVNVGPSKAEAIVAYRKANGAFKSAEQLALVKGIGLKTVEKNRDRIVLGAVAPATKGKTTPAKAIAPAKPAARRRHHVAAQGCAANVGAGKRPSGPGRMPDRDVTPPACTRTCLRAASGRVMPARGSGLHGDTGFSAARYTPRMCASRVIPANEYRRERWRNGLGWTREIHAARAHAGHGHAELALGGHGSAMSSRDGEDRWDWRISIAEIESDAPFSSFKGVDRVLVLLSGNGLRLRFQDGELQTLLPPHGQSRFNGERQVRGELIDGTTQDFNLMWRRDNIAAQLWHRPLVGPMVVFADPGATWVVHLMAGQARFADDSGLPDLAAGDTALLEAGDTRLRQVIEGAGEALVIRLQPSG